MRLIDIGLGGVQIIEPDRFKDSRGYCVEVYQYKRYLAFGIESSFVQDNLSFSRKGVLRGLHYQFLNQQAKLVHVIKGEIFDVAVDIRKRAPSFGKWISVVLSESNGRELYMPSGFAHGFCVLGKIAYVMYKCSDYYSPKGERGVLWSDPDLGMEWPVRDPILSEKDVAYPCLKEISFEELPGYEDAN